MPFEFSIMKFNLKECKECGHKQKVRIERESLYHPYEWMCSRCNSWNNIRRRRSECVSRLTTSPACVVVFWCALVVFAKSASDTSRRRRSDTMTYVLCLRNCGIITFCHKEWKSLKGANHHCALLKNHYGGCVCSCGMRHAHQILKEAKWLRWRFLICGVVVQSLFFFLLLLY